VIQGVAVGLVGIAGGLWLLGDTHRSVASVPARPRPQESAWVVESGSSFADSRFPAGPAPVRPKRRRPPAALTPLDTNLRPPVAAAEPDSSLPPIKLSPFLRSRPWLAVEGGRFYYSRDCVVQLGSRQLVFFGSEEEARAQGYRRGRGGCPGGKRGGGEAGGTP
jgi:hypothetical protein